MSEAELATGDSLDTRSRLVRYFRKYSPEKLNTIDAVLKKYEGRETQLFGNLEKKYGPEPDYEDNGVVINSGQNTPTSEDNPEEDQTVGADGSTKKPPRTYLERATAMYEVYEPSKISLAKQQIDKHPGKEEAVIKALVKKFGPEPKSPRMSTNLENSSSLGQEPSEVVLMQPSASAESERCYLERAVAMYEAYEPEKVHLAKQQLDKHPGKEDAVIKALVKKYGPEPTPTENLAVSNTRTPTEEDQQCPTPEVAAPAETKPGTVALTAERSEVVLLQPVVEVLPEVLPPSSEDEGKTTSVHREVDNLGDAADEEVVEESAHSSFNDVLANALPESGGPTSETAKGRAAATSALDDAEEEAEQAAKNHKGDAGATSSNEEQSIKAATADAEKAEDEATAKKAPQDDEDHINEEPATESKSPDRHVSIKTPPANQSSEDAQSSEKPKKRAAPRLFDGKPAYMAPTRGGEARGGSKSPSPTRPEGGDLDADESQSSSRKKVHLTLYSRSLESMERQKKEAASRRQQRDETESANCTFQPGISALAHNLPSNDEPAKRFGEWSATRQKHIEKARKQVLKEEMSEVKESVTLGTKTQQIIQKMKSEERHRGIVEDWSSRRDEQEARRKQLEKELTPSFTPNQAAPLNKHGRPSPTRAPPHAKLTSDQQDRLYTAAMLKRAEREKEKAQEVEAEKKKTTLKVRPEELDRHLGEMNRKIDQSQRKVAKLRQKDAADKGETYKPRINRTSKAMAEQSRKRNYPEEYSKGVGAQQASYMDHLATKPSTKVPVDYISPEEKVAKEVKEHHPPSKKLTAEQQERFALRQQGHVLRMAEKKAQIVPSEQLALEVCTFAPRISHVSSQLAERSTKVKNHRYSDPTESAFVSLTATDSETFHSTVETANNFLRELAPERHTHIKSVLPSSHASAAHGSCANSLAGSGYVFGSEGADGVGPREVSTVERRLIEKRRLESEALAAEGATPTSLDLLGNSVDLYDSLLRDSDTQSELRQLNRKGRDGDAPKTGPNPFADARSKSPSQRRSASPHTIKWVGSTSGQHQRSNSKSTQPQSAASPAPRGHPALNPHAEDLDAKIANLEAAVANWKSVDTKR